MFSRRNLNICLVVLGYLAISSSLLIAGTIDVPSDYTSIQDAINAAVNGDEIEVAPGTYLEAIDFSGKAIRLYSSGGPALTTINGTGYYHVVQCVSGEASDTVLEGFTITGGNANGDSPNDSGGGMYCYSSSPTVTNCTFTGNLAESSGGGMHSWNWGQPTVTDCTFISNSAGYQGGGLAIRWYSVATISGCSFSGNTVTGGQFCNGGGLSVSFDLGTSVTNCTFTSNSASYGGGGMYNGNHIRVYGPDPSAPATLVTNCTFIGNSAPNIGGAMYNMQSGPEITNCTLTDNTTFSGGAIMTYYGGEANKMIPILTNCILWDDIPDEIVDSVSVGVPPATFVDYSDVQGGWSGIGNINLDPVFADADGRLLPGSPCIDAGDDSVVVVTTDIDGNPRIQGLCVDMGVFEATADPIVMLTRQDAYIQQQVNLGNIDAEIETSLLAKVDAAISALERGNPNDAKVAMNDLKALVNQVEAQTDKKITAEAAAAMIISANQIIAILGG